MDLSVYDSDELCCPICMEPWKSQGDHQVCCLPCGHIYGASCITRWKKKCGGRSAECPQCSSKFKLKDIRKLYGSPIVMVDEDLQEKIRSLEAEIESLKLERDNILRKLSQ